MEKTECMKEIENLKGVLIYSSLKLKLPANFHLD